MNRIPQCPSILRVLRTMGGRAQKRLWRGTPSATKTSSQDLQSISPGSAQWNSALCAIGKITASICQEWARSVRKKLLNTPPPTPLLPQPMRIKAVKSEKPVLTHRNKGLTDAISSPSRIRQSCSHSTESACRDASEPRGKAQSVPDRVREPQGPQPGRGVRSAQHPAQ